MTFMKNNPKMYLFTAKTTSRFIYIFPVILLILTISHTFSFYRIEKKHILEKSVSLLKDAIKEDFQDRSQILTEQVITRTIPSTDTTPDSCIFKSKTIEIKAPALPNRPLDEKITDFLQSVLAVKNPINVYRLDDIFQQKLKKENIHIATALCLTDTINKKNNNCTHTSTASFIPLFTESYPISSTGINLRAYIKIPITTLIKRMPVSYWISLMGWGIFILSTGYAWHNVKKRIPAFIKNSRKREHAIQLELTRQRNELETFKQQKTDKKEQNIHRFSSNLLFKKDTKTLHFQDGIIKLTIQQQELLTILCNSPKKTCSINELRNGVWKDCNVEKNTIHQAISRLNSTLKPFELHILNESKDSYKIIHKKQ